MLEQGCGKETGDHAASGDSRAILPLADMSEKQAIIKGAEKTLGPQAGPEKP
jgi:hypothetical protein